MTIFNSFLSNLKVGEQVRITQTNGNVMEGTVMQNDGQEAVLLNISMSALVRYTAIDSIAVISPSRQSAPVIHTDTADVPETISAPSAVPDKKVINVTKLPAIKPLMSEKKLELCGLEIGKDEFEESITGLDEHDRQMLETTCAAVLSACDNYQNETMRTTAASNLVMLAQSDKIHDKSKVYVTAAMGTYLLEEFQTSAEYFYYAGDIRKGYLSAYEQVHRFSDMSKSQSVGALAALYILYGETEEHLEEAAAYLRETAISCKDISGIAFVLENAKNPLHIAYAFEALKQVCSKARVDFAEDSAEKSLQFAKEIYPNNDIVAEIENISYKKSQLSSGISNVSAAAPPKQPVESFDTLGELTFFNKYKDSGKITGQSGKIYTFKYGEVDEALNKRLDNLLKKNFILEGLKIGVAFTAHREGSNLIAEGVRLNFKAVPITDPYKLMTQKQDFAGALIIFKQWLADGRTEPAIAGCIQCYLYLIKHNVEKSEEYKAELAELLKEYADKVPMNNTQNFNNFSQAFNALKDWQGCIDTIERAEKVGFYRENNKKFDAIGQKAQNYKKMGELQKAFDEYKKMEEFAEANKLINKQDHIFETVYLEMAEILFELGDYKGAEYYGNTAAVTDLNRDRVNNLLARLESITRQQTKLLPDTDNSSPAPNEETNTADTPDTSDTDEETSQNEQSDEELTETVEYIDDNAFDTLITSDKEIIETALSFKPEQMYCAAAYLAAAERICENADVDTDRKSDSSDMPVADSIISASRMFNNAYEVHGFCDEQDTSRILFDYQNICYSMPNDSLNFLMARLLRIAFSSNSIQPFDTENILEEIRRAEDNDYAHHVLSLTDIFNHFKTKTVCCMDLFSDYNRNNEAVKEIISEAKDCADLIGKTMNVSANQSRVERTRELIFHNESSALAYALNAVCQNDVGTVSKVRQAVAKAFMRNDDKCSINDIDNNKIDAIIDDSWDMAKGLILSEVSHRNMSKPHDNLRGGTKIGMVKLIKRILDCVCRWVNISENAEITGNPYFTLEYNANRSHVIDILQTLIQSAEEDLNNHFEWGIHSIYTAASEILSKMEGTYDPAEKKYMFVDFLRTGHILLDESYVPDISSTFSNLPDFNIFARIKAHAQTKLPPFKGRIQQIFSGFQHYNFRSARLIQEYAQYTNDKEVCENPKFSRLDELIRQSRSHNSYYEYHYQDFKNNLELRESNGTISNIKGYKSLIIADIDAWYSISCSTGDFGFFSDIMTAYDDAIMQNAKSTAEKIMQQLNDIADSGMDFGIYSRDTIEGYIQDGKFSVAENILNCIRRGDVESIRDFTQTPKEIFDDFMGEYENLYRAVSDTKVTMVQSFCSYYNSRTIDKALKESINIRNGNKEVKGGIRLLQNWPLRLPATEERVKNIVSLLGFNVNQVQADDNKKYDVYNITLNKRTGKVNYLYPIPAFGSEAETDGIRVLVIYGRHKTDSLITKLLEVESLYIPKNTIILLDSVISKAERRYFAKKIKENLSLSKTYLLVDRVLFLYLAKHYQNNIMGQMLMAASLPFAYNQPFRPKPNAPVPADMFTGREMELEQIKASDGVNLVYGGRQLGKSSLLQMAAYQVDRQFDSQTKTYTRAVVIPIKGMDYTTAARHIARQLVLNDILPESDLCEDWETLTWNIQKRLNDQSNPISYLLLMLDEADTFIESCKPVKYAPITRMQDILSKKFKFVLAGLHNLAKFDREFSSDNSGLIHLSHCVIHPFKTLEATELLTHSLAYLGFVFSDEIINLILAKTNYFPGLIHLYGQKLILAMKSNDYAGYSENETPYYYVTDSHIKKILADQDFKDEIKNKLRATLEVDGRENSPYYVIALILSYLYYEEESKEESQRKTGFTIADVMDKAKSDEINLLLQYNDEQITELFNEMWDLNILTSKDGIYMFSTEGFRELLGTKGQVNEELSGYMGGTQNGD